MKYFNKADYKADGSARKPHKKRYRAPNKVKEVVIEVAVKPAPKVIKPKPISRETEVYNLANELWGRK